MSSTLQASVFMWKEHSENLRSIKNTGNTLTMKQMFDISEKLIVGQSDEIYGVNAVGWVDSSWKYLSLIGDEQVISLSHAKVFVVSDSVLCLEKMNQNPQSNAVWEDKLTWFKSSPEYRALDKIDGEPMEFEWNIFPAFTTLQLVLWYAECSMSSTLESSVFMLKNYSENWHSIKNTEDLTMKQMFDISAKLVSEQDEIYGLKTIDRENSSWKYLSLIGDEQVISLQRTKVYVFSDSVLCLGKMNENPQSNYAWEQRLEWFTSTQENRTLDRIDGEPMEFEWNISPGFKTLQFCIKVQEFMSKMSEKPEEFTGRIIFMSMFNDVSWGSEDNEQECELNSNFVSIFARIFSPGRWWFLVPGSEKKWYSTHDSKPRGKWDRVAELMMIKFGESGHPVFRATSPLSRGTLKSRGGGKLSIHFCADGWTIETVFRTIISVNQFSIYGAVSDLCEEYKACHVRTVRLVMAGQSDPLFVPTSSLMKTPTRSTDDPAQEDLLQKYQGRVEMLSQQNRVIKICTDAGFLKTVEVGQYFITMHTDEFLQFAEPVACREYTLPRDEKLSDPTGWIRGNTKIGPVLEVTTSYLQGKFGVESRIESICKQRQFSLVGQNFSWLE